MSAKAAKPVLRRARADADVEKAIDFYLRESAEVALGFVDALEAVFRRIGRSPSIGSPRYAHALNLPGLRFQSCKRYPYLVFYVEHADHLDVWRVLHAHRDIPHWLVEDDGPA